MAKADWVTVTDAAGVERCVRSVDAREILAQCGTTSDVIPADEKRADGTPCETYTEAESKAHIEVDDQSVAPKVSKKK